MQVDRGLKNLALHQGMKQKSKNIPAIDQNFPVLTKGGSLSLRSFGCAPCAPCAQFIKSNSPRRPCRFLSKKPSDEVSKNRAKKSLACACAGGRKCAERRGANIDIQKATSALKVARRCHSHFFRIFRFHCNSFITRNRAGEI